MDKNEILQYVTELQELRERFTNYTFFSNLPIEHYEMNFEEGIDRAVEAVLSVYTEEVLAEIQLRNEKG
jgi:hypothetical protein|nr:MAG TPA: hypothetical protein [Caudoviricetes sp.]